MDNSNNISGKINSKKLNDIGSSSSSRDKEE